MPCIQPGPATCPHSSPSAIGTICQVTQDALLSHEGCPMLTAPRSPLPRRWLVMGGRACSSATFPLPERVASIARGLSCVKHLSGTWPGPLLGASQTCLISIGDMDQNFS